jgi:hypothetical protein
LRSGVERLVPGLCPERPPADTERERDTARILGAGARHAATGTCGRRGCRHLQWWLDYHEYDSPDPGDQLDPIDSRRHRRGRPRRVKPSLRAHSLTVAVIWAVATLIGLAIARTTKIGPILVVLAPEHGGHVGDVFAFALAYLVAAAVSMKVVP